MLRHLKLLVEVIIHLVKIFLVFLVVGVLVYLVFFVLMPGWKPNMFVKSSAYAEATFFLIDKYRIYESFPVYRSEYVSKIHYEGELPTNCRGFYSVQIPKERSRDSYFVRLARFVKGRTETWQVYHVYEVVDGRKKLIYQIEEEEEEWHMQCLHTFNAIYGMPCSAGMSALYDLTMLGAEAETQEQEDWLNGLVALAEEHVRDVCAREQ